MGRSIFNAYRDAYRGLPREIWLLSFALLINRCGSMVLAFLTLYLTEKIGFTVFEAGAIFAIYGLGSIAGSYAGGRLIKHVGAIRIQILSLAIAAPLFCIVPEFESFQSIALAIFSLSFFVESVRPANNVAVMQFTTPELRTQAYGLQRMAVNLGMSIGPAAGGLLADYNFDYLFYVDGATTLLGAIVLACFFGLSRISDKAGDSQKQEQALSGVGSPWGDPKFMLFLLLLLGVAMVFFQFHATYPKYLKDHYQMTKPMIGYLFAVNTIIIVIVEMLLLNEVKRFNLLRTIGWGGFLACFGFAILPCSKLILFAVVSMYIITLGEMLIFPLATTFTAQQSEGRDAGSYMSWYAMTYSITAVIAPLIGTAIYSLHPDAIWWCSGGVGIVALIGFYWLGAQRKKSTEMVKAT